ncbi:signal transduction histidine kinase/HAMP domain-containing protein/CheY-like chemotaxis protein [Pseudomonas laurylsulfativorans]|uniref:HAMP domain-containing protein n=1 Tax=Pseudomonas laurylsulfativorans TaxID=1943631 RepID=UPI0020A16844|nr:HAMP domain-containing protein [Pseudomonas laurylsulfativorans]MCP1419558.1 signal transduction histidine kinase/HAMP domain-containing protein/CheY-like chemotaxis protein [Pseudomonas laurylsulfativorans]
MATVTTPIEALDMKTLLAALKALRNGDFTQRMPQDWTGMPGKIADTLNEIFDMAADTATEFERVARLIGKQGLVDERIELPMMKGSWQKIVNSSNALTSDLISPMSEMIRVIGSVAEGNLSQQVPPVLDGLRLRGEFLKSAKIVNTMVTRLGSFASEVTRVAREVGTEGILGGQANVKGVSGTWKDLTDSVNDMAANLTTQMRNIAYVTTAVAKGDLGKTITVEVRGEILELKNTINTMVGQLSSFAAEVTRVALEVGTEGKLGGQAEVRGVSGTWRDLTESVNGMAANLTTQVRNLAQVTTAVARGDLGKKITVEAKGEILELKNTINTMVDQLSSFASEVTRVALEVGTEGKLGGQAEVTGVSGTWKDLTNSVNGMAANLTTQVRNIADVTTAVANGDLSRKITAEAKGEILQLKETINTMVDQLSTFADEVTRMAREVGTDGKLGGQARVTGVGGTWKDLTDSVNSMAANLTNQVRNIADVTTAVAKGDLGRKITVEAKGEIMELKNTINTMVDQLNSFAAEVTRVAREVGTEGKLGGQAQVQGVSGTWRDLTENVNFMAANLTSQVRGIAKVVTAVANGDMKKKLTLEAKGEIAELADTINGMTDTLALFSDQVTSVAREVGVEGKLGGQANVPGAAGTWRDLTDNVNGLAANLTNQVRAIADVATAVTKGDLTRYVEVEAKGEVAELKDNVNEMIRNLRETTRQNAEQDWLKSNLAKFNRLLQGQRDLAAVSKMVLSELAPLINAQHGVFYMMNESPPDPAKLKLLSAYAYKGNINVNDEWRLGEGLVGQCAYEKRRILLTDVPADYVAISSGLGAAAPLNIIVLPILFENKVKAVVEMASFTRFSIIHQTFLDQLAESIGIVLNTIEANMRTEELLKQSQSLAQELQKQQEELRQTNEELGDKAGLLAEQKAEVERKNREVEITKLSLEEKAEQLTLTSKYKSEFLSSMSHELRTPLNSLLILARQLSDNAEHNLTPRQVEYAKTIRSAGKDLLELIDEILYLSKIESGTVTLDLNEARFADLHEQIERTFRPVAESRGLTFTIELAPTLPPVIRTDEKRLLQVVKNLLSNAFKFTEQGSVKIRIEPAVSGWSVDNSELNRANAVIAFVVTDTGIGVSASKQKLIFEAFQQADTGTSRKYGGTGLGLSISRELAHRLGGELRLLSGEIGKGSTFALYVPLRIEDAQYQTLDESTTEAVPGQVRRDLVSSPSAQILDDRESVQPGNQVLLMLEGDARFASILLEAARKKGFKAIVTTRGAQALELVERFKPVAITLDPGLTDIDGWALLEQLKRNFATRHIPVQIISSADDHIRGLRYGAFACLLKPVTADEIENALVSIVKFARRKSRNLLLIDGDDGSRARILDLLGNTDVKIETTASGASALKKLAKKRYDCLAINLELPDASGLRFLEALQQDPAMRELPIVVYGAETLTKAHQERFRTLLGKGVIKAAQSPERILDETALFLHRVIDRLPQTQRSMLEKLYEGSDSLEGKTALVVDDDVRNIFALTSVLERYKMQVATAENGRTAIELLQQQPDTDIVLMDIMMPEMDGFETMRQIRTFKRFETLPMIALTAKAMMGDREKCIEAGASDYVSKPVDTDQLLSLMRKWLYR